MLNKLINKIAITRYNKNYNLTYSIFNKKLSKYLGYNTKVKDLKQDEYIMAYRLAVDWAKKLNIKV